MSPYHPKKRLGQHFLQSDQIINDILKLLSPEKEDNIVEIGPGQGALTFPLARSGAKIIAVEFDRDIIAALHKELKGFTNVELLNLDFLTFDPHQVHLKHFKLVGNLPYNITSPVMEWIMTFHHLIKEAVLMIQLEVARRICSKPGSKDWSPLSIFTQLGFDTSLCFEVKPEHFQPPPKVTSAVIRLLPKEIRKVSNPELFEKVVRTSFRQRRKLLVNNLVPILLSETSLAQSVLKDAGLPERCRAEQLSIDDFLTLTRVIADYTIK